MKVSYNITQNKFNASLNQETTEIKVSFKTGYYPLPVGLENYYTKNETDLLLENYYLKTETYSQNEIDSLFLNETLDVITERGNTTENDITVRGVTTDYVQLDTTSDNTYSLGKFYWNETKGTYDFGLKNNVTLQLGQEQNVYGKAYSAITNGQLVMYRTSQGGHILFEPANFTQLSSNPDLIIGVATQDIALNDFGYITTFGEVNTLNTSSFADGNTLYFGSGNVLQNTIPSGSYFIVGRVNRSHTTQGSIFVKPYFVDSNLVPYTGATKDVNIASNYFKTSKGFDYTFDENNYFRTFHDGNYNQLIFESNDDIQDYLGILCNGQEGFNVQRYSQGNENFFTVSENVTYSEKPFLTNSGFKILNGTPNLSLTADGGVFDLNLKLSVESQSTTGTAISFIIDKVYGTLTTPETGNITADVTNAKLGVTNIIIHNSGTTPTFGSEFKKLSGSGNYVAGVVNYIYCTFINTTEIIYSINQRT